MEIRSITPEEIPACAAVIRESFLTVANQLNLTPENAPSNPAFLAEERLQEEYDRGVWMYGLSDSHRLCGFVALENRGEGLFYLERLSVLPGYRHKGLGEQLLDFARETVRESGGSRISIGIVEENTVLRDWYARYGFVHTGIKTFPHLPFTVGFMELHI